MPAPVVTPPGSAGLPLRMRSIVALLGRRVSDVPSKGVFAGQYLPYSRAVSYMATTFSVGELS
jgi:hypothetical protein